MTADPRPVALADLPEQWRQEAQDIRLFARHETPSEQRRLHAQSDVLVSKADQLEAALRAASAPPREPDRPMTPEHHVETWRSLADRYERAALAARGGSIECHTAMARCEVLRACAGALDDTLRAAPSQPSPLATLREKVEQLRAEAAKNHQQEGTSQPVKAFDLGVQMCASRVLHLIDDLEGR